MKVYIVELDEYENSGVIGVFSTKEAAQAHVDHLLQKNSKIKFGPPAVPEDYMITEYEVDVLE